MDQWWYLSILNIILEIFMEINRNASSIIRNSCGTGHMSIWYFIADGCYAIHSTDTGWLSNFYSLFFSAAGSIHAIFCVWIGELDSDVDFRGTKQKCKAHLVASDEVVKLKFENGFRLNMKSWKVDFICRTDWVGSPIGCTPWCNEWQRSKFVGRKWGQGEER